MDYDLPETINHEKQIVIIIIAIIISAAIGYMGYHQFMKWHENKLQAAVSEQQQKMAEKSADLEYQIITLQNKLTMLEPPPVSDDRITEVFGKPQSYIAAETDHSCDAMKHKITSFFTYLHQNSYVDANQSEKNPSDVFLQMVRALSAHPPMIVDETRDLVSLKHNLAHFYRILHKERIAMVKNIMAAENDVLEHAMADFYTYYVTGDCCKNDDEPCVSLNTLYEYAGFFMNTFAGKSYLFRRSSAIRCLTDYYAVLVLDRANDAEINQYGIDIRPYIDLALDNITSQNNLLFQDQYLDTLTNLQEKYSS
ncbi:MAG: hypothetical protein HF978_17910 [Desulfobacteraceae bacterium]|nr:hypothetical protein [Desulfobacteraceae bacterium]MBC2757423.1 hypothetical protein [Desulfobacteraceae bacterium]MBC2763827.1 hypothetical protein [ANME-2 cluster archaeon]